MRPVGTTRAKKPILKKEFERLIHAANKSISIKSVTKVKLIRAFTLLYLTGCRVSEIANMSAKDVEHMIRENEYSLTNATKTRTPRLIIFDDARVQVEFLKKILPKDAAYLFQKNNSAKPMSASSLTALLNGFIHAVLGELYSTHSFRAGYITAFHAQGYSLEHIRCDIGHADIATTAHYVRVSQEEIARSKSARAW